jgi:hypothetical protein
MPDISDSRQTATAYPQTETYAEWSDHADELDMSVSRYILAMVEVGRKEIDLSIDHDDETVELRTQRNDLKRELAGSEGPSSMCWRRSRQYPSESSYNASSTTHPRESRVR